VCGWCCLRARLNCGESVTVYQQKGVEGGCNYEGELSMYNGPLLLGSGMGWMVDKSDASLLTGHQDLTPNSDAARLRLDSPHYQKNLS
jgi:hypothetical protein